MVSRFVRYLVQWIGRVSLNRQTRTDSAAPAHIPSSPARLSGYHLSRRSGHFRALELPADHVTGWLVVQIDGTLGFPARGMAGLGIVVRNEHGDVIRLYDECAPAHTSNEAEYWAFIIALRLVQRDFPNRRVRCLTDSRLVVDQLSGAAPQCGVNLCALFITLPAPWSPNFHRNRLNW